MSASTSPHPPAPGSAVRVAFSGQPADGLVPMTRRRRAAVLDSRVVHRWWAILLVETALVTIAALDVAPWPGVSFSTADRVAAGLSVGGLLLRRRWPVLTWLAGLPALVLALVVVTPVITVFSVVRRSRHRWVSVGVVAATFVASLVAAYLQGVTAAGRVADVQTVVLAALTAGGPAAFAAALNARASLAVRLREAVAMQDRERVLLTGSVIAEERTRLAREMHDVVSHQVSLIALQAGALRMTTHDRAARAAASTIRGLAGQTLDELRVMVGVLRGDTEEELTPQPRLCDVPRLVADSGLPAVLSDELSAHDVWSDQVQRAAYRTVQEGLTNVRKHSPGATVQVRLRSRDRTLQVTVRNSRSSEDVSTARARVDGVRAVDGGAPLPDGGHGLLGLRERADMFRGHVRAGFNDLGGFDLVVDFYDPR